MEYNDRIDAREASKGCEYCSGEGLATVWHPAPDDRKGIPRTVAAFCTCPHGRWMLRQHSVVRDFQGVNKGTPDLARVLRGKSIWLAYDPEFNFVPEPKGP